MANTLWDSCIEQLAIILDQRTVDGWLRPMEASIENSTLILAAPNKFLLDEVDKNYRQTIELVVKKFEPDFHVQLKQGTPKTLFDQRSSAPKNTCQAAEFASKLRPEYTFDSFVEGSSNQIAANSAMGVAKKPDGTFNPLMIYGSTGLGKSHLMHAIGNAVKAGNHKKKVVYQTAEQFMHEMVSAIAESSDKINQFKQYYRSVDVLLIDDVQFFAGKNKTQEEFFHLFNILRDASSQIVLTCDRYPKEVEGLEGRLKSRFGAGLSVAVEPPDLETRAAILKKKAALIDFELDGKVALFIAEKVQSHVRDLEGALNSVYATAQFSNQPATIELAKVALRDILSAQRRQVSVENIQKTVASYYGIKVSDLKSKNRKTSIARPRQMAMALAKQLTSLSLPDIGEAFERDHTTVIHAIKKIDEMKSSDPKIREDMANLVTTLSH
ncbi:MAG: chromosomal replication initiator protein DnaA [Gammaproteobacteria bacterium]|nr:MAG: chromosomal replication initiator protein DnaA [Gammaproteobacteria bacterium]